MALGNIPQKRSKSYCALIESQLDKKQLDQVRDATNGNYALRDIRFQREIEQHLDRRVTRGRPGSLIVVCPLPKIRRRDTET